MASRRGNSGPVKTSRQRNPFGQGRASRQGAQSGSACQTVWPSPYGPVSWHQAEDKNRAVTGTPLSARQGQWAAPVASPYRLLGLTLEREELYRRIEARVDAMLAAGLLDEVRRLRAAGLEHNRTASQAIGYKELLAHLRGEYSLATAVELVKQATRRFAKHQMTWFRKDPRIHWYDVARYADAAQLAEQILSDLFDKSDSSDTQPEYTP